MAAATTYYYRVCAYNADGVSAYSNTVTVITLTVGPPAAPSNLTASPFSSSAISLAWVRNSTNETGFKIERGTAAAGPFTQVSLGSAGATSYTDSGLATGTAYFYRIRATNASGDSAYSNTATATTQSPALPAAPSSLNAISISSSEITLTWADNSTNESNFKLERAGSVAGPFTQVALPAANTTSYTNSGLSAATAYFYRIRAANPAGDSAYSNTANATTSSSAPPAAPTNLAATATSSSTIALAWNDNSTNETGFKVERAPLATGIYAQVGAPAAGATSYNDPGLAASTTYLYRVRATNAAGDSAYSNTATATTQAPAPPAAPSNLTAAATSSSAITLAWNDNSNNETGFKVERATSATGPFAQVGTPAAGTTSHSDGGLLPATTYYYRVRATNAGGDSAYSNIASAITQALTFPLAPSNLLASAASSSSISLSWLDNSGNETGFKIERGPNASSFAQIGTTAANVLAFADTGLAAGTSYVYRVRAANGAGDSGYSNIATAQTTGTTRYRLTVNLSGIGSGVVTSGPAGINCGSTCTADYSSGTSVGLTAFPNTGSGFAGWTGVDLSTGTSATVQMTGNKTVVAAFGFAAGSVTLASLPATSSTGTYTLSWTYSGRFAPSNWQVQEDDNPGFSSPNSYTSYDGTSPYTYGFTSKPDGVYYYPVRQPPPSTGFSNVATITVARPSASILRIQNSSHYDLIDLRLDGVQKLNYPYVVPVGGYADFTYTGTPTVRVDLSVGFYNSSGGRDIWFFMNPVYRTMAPGAVAVITFNNPTLAQVLTNFGSARNYDGDYWHNLVYGWARFRFFSDGTYTFYDNGAQTGSGTVSLVSWPNYATVIYFKVQSTGEQILLAYPFGQFYYANGPSDWRIIQYTAQ